MKYYAFLAALALTLAGCGKQDSNTPAGQDAEKAATATTDALKQGMDAAKAEAGKVADSAKAAGEKAVTEASSKAQELIDKAKSLVEASKFQDASAVLQQLSGMNLNDAQQKLVATLKEQIQKALVNKTTSDAKSAVGDLLGGKK